MSFKPEIILGPPGTGKTTALLNLVDDALKAGVSSKRIAFVTFTKKASTEAIDRAKEKFALTEKKLPYFRTLHSMAFRIMGMTRSQVMAHGDLRDFGRIMGVRLTGAAASEDGSVVGHTDGDKAMFIYNLARMRCIPIEEQFHENPEDLDWKFVDWMARGVDEFKQSRALIDFTGMLEEYVNGWQKGPELDLLVVDEAQDLSQIQWRMVMKMSKQAKRTVISGDDDQAIFRWAGADIPFFINLSGRTKTLNKSYRVPKQVQLRASGLLEAMEQRRNKVWEARDGEGGVTYHNMVEEVDMSKGSWLVLCRNAYLLDESEEQCRREGFIYARAGKKSISEKDLNTIKAWEELRKGGECSAPEAVNIMRYVKCKKIALPENGRFTLNDLRMNWSVLSDEIWHEAFIKMALVERAYLVAALRRGEPVSKTPRIQLSTIHGAKGGEADNVVLYLDMARRTFDGMVKTPDDEQRVFYVGATRTRNHLHLITPKTKYAFNFA